MKRTMWGLAALASIIGLASGPPACDAYETILAEGKTCTATSECPAYAACTGGTCLVRCGEGLECPSYYAQSCERGVCFDTCSLPQSRLLEAKVFARPLRPGYASTYPRESSGFTIDETNAYWIESDEPRPGSLAEPTTPSAKPTYTLWRQSLRGGSRKELVLTLAVTLPGEGWNPYAVRRGGDAVYITLVTTSKLDGYTEEEAGLRYHLARVPLAAPKLEIVRELDGRAFETRFTAGDAGPPSVSPTPHATPEAIFVGNQLLFKERGSDVVRRMDLTTGAMDPTFAERDVSRFVASEQRLIWVSRRDRVGAPKTWEFRYMDLPNGKPTWSSVDASRFAPSEYSHATDSLAQSSTAVFGGVFGAFGTYALINRSRVDTASPGAEPETWPPRSSVPEGFQAIALARDVLLAFETKKRIEDASPGPVNASGQLVLPCARVNVHSAATGEASLLGSTGSSLEGGGLFGERSVVEANQGQVVLLNANGQQISVFDRSVTVPAPLP